MLSRFSSSLTSLTSRHIAYNYHTSTISAGIHRTTVISSPYNCSAKGLFRTPYGSRTFSTSSASSSEGASIESLTKEIAPKKRAPRKTKTAVEPAPSVEPVTGEPIAVSSETTTTTTVKSKAKAPKKQKKTDDVTPVDGDAVAAPVQSKQLGDDANQLLKDIQNMSEKPKKSKALLASERGQIKAVTFKSPAQTDGTIIPRGEEITERYIIVGVDKCHNIDYIHSTLQQLSKKYGDIPYPISTSYYSSIQYDTRRNEILALLREPTHRLKTSPIVFLTQTRFMTPQIMPLFSDRPLVPFRYVGNHIDFIKHMEQRLKDPSLVAATTLMRQARALHRPPTQSAPKPRGKTTK